MTAVDRHGIDPTALREGLLARLNPRSKSLIVTVFGDSILPHGGGTWLGDLIRILAPLRLGERVVRTSVFRLSQDGLVKASQHGRRSYYALTRTGVRQFLAASRRIYAVRDDHWTGTWTQVWLSGLISEDSRAALRTELKWLGFTSLAPDLLIHASVDRETVHEAIDGLELQGIVSVLSAEETADPGRSRRARDQVTRHWPLGAIGDDHGAFIDAFAPLAGLLRSGATIEPSECFALRSLLVHDYRRVVLRDPMLPADLLPRDWPGLRAAALAREIYHRLAWPAQQHVMRSLETQAVPFEAPAPEFEARFGGLPVLETA